MGADQVVGDAKPQPHPFSDAPTLAALEERLEDLLLFILRDSGSAILDANPQPTIILTRCDMYFSTRRSKFDRVARQIADHLGEAHLVDLSGGQVIRNFNLPIEVFFRRGFPQESKTRGSQSLIMTGSRFNSREPST